MVMPRAMTNPAHPLTKTKKQNGYIGFSKSKQSGQPQPTTLSRWSEHNKCAINIAMILYLVGYRGPFDPSQKNITSYISKFSGVYLPALVRGAQGTKK